MISNEEQSVLTRPATVADTEFLWEVQFKALGPYVTEQFGTTVEQQREFFDRHLRVETHHIVELGNERIGSLFYDERPDGIYLGNLAILPLYQNRGIGTELARSVIARADAAGRTVTLQVLKSNPRARRLYERLGFARVGDTEGHVIMSNAQPR